MKKPILQKMTFTSHHLSYLKFQMMIMMMMVILYTQEFFLNKL